MPRLFLFILVLFTHLGHFSFSDVQSKLPWDHLKKYNDALTLKDFKELAKVYSPDGSLYAYIEITPHYIDIYSEPTKTKPALFRLLLAQNQNSKKKNLPFFKNFKEQATSQKPLQGLRILIDPGHIGGSYAKMEQRVLRREDGATIQEGDLNLKTAFLLQKQLTYYGAKVYLTKNKLAPITQKKPQDFLKQAKTKTNKETIENNSISQEILVEKNMNRLFYRESEIRARAEMARRIKPDLTLCIHYNATPASLENPWTIDNRLVIFVHGSYEPNELGSEEQLFRLFSKLLENSSPTEIAIAEKIATSMQKTTGLPAVEYIPSSQYIKVGKNPCLYARNLAANRLYPGPVIYLEPYYQNNQLVFDRLIAGDYKGIRKIQGQDYRSIFRDYADGVTKGILEFFNTLRTSKHRQKN